MLDPYLYPDSNVLRNLLDIHDGDALDLAEAELSRAHMMLLYEQVFSDFSSEGMQAINKTLFGDVYDWAGEFRTINIQKREKLLAGQSVWYSDVNTNERDLKKAWKSLHAVSWKELTPEKFSEQMERFYQNAQRRRKSLTNLKALTLQKPTNLFLCRKKNENI